ncbi:MAG: hypothetical protein O3A00_13615 [Planctomycetota bacterium]|nr:hypothetical protein [Planctomycetota bacterium]
MKTEINKPPISLKKTSATLIREHKDYRGLEDVFLGHANDCGGVGRNMAQLVSQVSIPNVALASAYLSGNLVRCAGAGNAGRSSNSRCYPAARKYDWMPAGH